MLSSLMMPLKTIKFTIRKANTLLHLSSKPKLEALLKMMLRLKCLFSLINEPPRFLMSSKTRIRSAVLWSTKDALFTTKKPKKRERERERGRCDFALGSVNDGDH